MNYEAQAILLRRISAGISMQSMILDTKALPKPGTHAYQSLTQQIQGWERQLRGITGSLDSQQGLLNKMSAGARGDYSAQQSVNAKAANIAGLRKQCLSLLEDLADLLAKLMGPERDGIAMANALKDALKNITKEGETLDLGAGNGEKLEQIIVKATGPADAPQVHRPAMGTGLLTLAVFMLVAAKKLLERKKD